MTRTITDILKHHEAVDVPQREREELLAHVLGKKREYVVAHGEEIIGPDTQNNYLALVRRRNQHEPLSYILGKKEFCGLEFHLTPDTLIPRDETEELVELVLKEIKSSSKKKGSFRIIDVGTGSGAIIIALAHSLGKENHEFTATEISKEALAVAKENAERILGENGITFVLADLLKNIKGKFDLIVSNPPYIPSSRIPELDSDVKDYEPNVALDGGEGGMKIIERLISQALPLLNTGGIFLMEMDHTQREQVKQFVRKSFPNFKVKVIKDSYGYDRFAKLWRK